MKKKNKNKHKVESARAHGSHVVISLDGDPCPRCGQATEIHQHSAISERHLAQPFYYSRWFYCVNRSCKTTLIMPDRFKVLAVSSDEAGQLDERERAIRGHLPPDTPPWEGPSVFEN